MDRQIDRFSDHHPIEGIMGATMDRMRDMVDVDTVIGEPITTCDGSTVIPISSVSFGFVSGGGEYRANPPKGQADDGRLPFAGGTGAGVTIRPMGFLVQGRDSVRLLPTQPYAPVDRMIELAPQIMSEIRRLLAEKNKKAPTPQPPQA